MILESGAVWIEVKSWESALSRSGGLKSKAHTLPEDVQAALAMESLEIMSTLRPQQSGNSREKLFHFQICGRMRFSRAFKSSRNVWERQWRRSPSKVRGRF